MKKLFFVTPIGSDSSEERRDSDFVLKNFLNPVAEKLGYDVLRSDLISTPGKVDDAVITQLVKSDLVVVDITGSNPNVMFELGFRYATKKPYVVISQSLESTPFDIRNIRTLQYTVTAPNIEEINSKLESMISLANESSNGTEDKGEEIGMDLVLEAVQTGDYSKIENFMKFAEKFNIPLND